MPATTDMREIIIPRTNGAPLRVVGRLVDQVRTPTRGDVSCEFAAYATAVGVAIAVRVIDSGGSEVGVYAAEAETFRRAEELPVSQAAAMIRSHSAIPSQGDAMVTDLIRVAFDIGQNAPFAPEPRGGATVDADC